MTAFIVGVDEAGRGPLAGPVVAAAVILNPEFPIDGLRDSKKLSEKKRDSLALLIKQRAYAWCVARAEVEEIDRLNILQASLLAMQRAVLGLNLQNCQVYVDGNQCPRLDYPVKAIVGGDGIMSEISAASILAKVARDAEMVAMEEHYPGYGFATHKGYPTARHVQSLRELGATPIHRRSFAPVRAVLENL